MIDRKIKGCQQGKNEVVEINLTLFYICFIGKLKACHVLKMDQELRPEKKKPQQRELSGLLIR